MNAPAVSPALLAPLSPLGALGPAGLQQAAALATRESMPRGLRTLDFPWAQQVVYLLRGELNLGYPDWGMHLIVGGHDEALMPLGRSGVSPTHVRAVTDAELLCFDENALDILVTWDQMVPPVPAGGAVDDWGATPGIFDFRKLAHGTFASLPAAHIENLLACFRQQAVSAGEVVVRQGEPGDCYYVIKRGRAQVTRAVGGADIELAELTAGDAFGEEALIANADRNATVTMKTDGELLRLEGADFIKLLREPLLQRVDAAEAQRRVAGGACWLDVRFPAEYRQDGLPGALNIPLNELRDALPGLSGARKYVVYCQTGRRSSAAAFLLSQHGFDASLLAGGLKAMMTREKTAA